MLISTTIENRKLRLLIIITYTVYYCQGFADMIPVISFLFIILLALIDFAQVEGVVMSARASMKPVERTPRLTLGASSVALEVTQV